jgi:hypothetical protein
MAALSIQVPYPVFYDRDGQPLDNGNIYIGVANLDPLTNPLQVYYDDALTITASQPLKTSGGYVYRNGTPAQLYVNATDFSILVNDSKNLFVYSFPEATGIGVGAASIEYDPPFAGAVTSGYTIQDKLSQYVSVKDFGAVGDGIADDTAAIQAAQQASKFVYVPPGDYSVSGLRIYDQVNLMGAGYENTRFLQRSAGQPAINCLSDATVGQLLSLRLENFGVVGHASASVAAVKIEALGVYAIYRSHFDMIISSCYQALNMQASTANNVFYCTFQMDIVGTQTTSVVLNGGVYNTYDFFIVGAANGRVIEHGGFNNLFTRLVTDGQIVCTGQNITYLGLSLEELPNTPPTPVGIVLGGFNQVLITPTIILNPTNSTKITHCIQPFASSLIINPRFLVTGTLNPFTANDNNWTLQGPGQNQCVNKMETVYTGSDASVDLRRVDIVGNVSSFMTAASGTYSGKAVQYLTVVGGVPFNYNILNSTDSMIFDPAGTVPLINVTLGYAGNVYRQGQTLSVYTKEAITALTWSGSANTSLFPASMSAGQTIRFVYHAATNKWYPT